VFKDGDNWCKGCKVGEPHYQGDIPSYYRDDCKHYNTRPIDQEVVDEVQLLIDEEIVPTWNDTIEPRWLVTLTGVD
jgi:hypothetical protein